MDLLLITRITLLIGTRVQFQLAFFNNFLTDKTFVVSENTYYNSETTAPISKTFSVLITVEFKLPRFRKYFYYTFNIKSIQPNTYEVTPNLFELSNVANIMDFLLLVVDKNL